MAIKPQFDRLAVSRVHGITIVNPPGLPCIIWSKQDMLTLPRVLGRG